MWYKNSYRRHLCDMHIDDWCEDFLSEFSPDEYLQNLKRAKIQSAMLYFQSHVGLCYYPTKTGKIHHAFERSPDKMRTLANLCHENGIFVTGYYSLIYNNWAHDTHPEWRMIDEDGRSKRAEGGHVDADFADDSASPFRYGLCCPNNPSYREFVRAQIKEMCEYFTFDGMFYDMLFWPHMCHCEHCRARWEREVGGDIPTHEDYTDARWLLHMHKRREWMGEFAHMVTDYTKELCPHVSVEHNVAYSALPICTTSNCEEVISACDYAGGDLYKDIYSQSFSCKFYKNISKNQPFEYMFSRCAPNLGAHTQLKSHDVMKSAVALTMAHHGATLVIDAIDPVGTLDTRVYDAIGEVFSELSPYEKHLSGESREDIGLYYSLKSKFSPTQNAYSNYAGVVQCVKTFAERHILSGVTGAYHNYENYKLIIAPMLTEEDAQDFERIAKYVENGGILYFSGGSAPTLMKKLLGVECNGYTKEKTLYISPKESELDCFGRYNERYPLSFASPSPIISQCDGKTLATLTLPYTNQNTVRFASIHSNPPGIHTAIPAMIAKTYGKGKVLWSALPIECEDLYDHQNILISLLEKHLGFASSISSDAPEDVELTLHEHESAISLCAVLLNTRQKARKLEDFSVTISCNCKVKCAIRVSDNKEIPFEQQGDAVTLKISGMDIFEMFLLCK